MTEKNKTTAIAEESKTLWELKNTKGMVVGKDRIERFQTAFRGEVIQPTDFGYERARKIWNASIDRHPGIIARCSGVADVVAAVNFARENELLVAVRGGGHNVSGTTVPECRVEQRFVMWIGRPMSLAWLFQQELYPRRASLGSH
jgi:hypothetical protein